MIASLFLSDNTHFDTATLTAELLHCAFEASNSVQKSVELIHISTICRDIADDLLKYQYQISAYTRFAINDPKLREIYAPAFRDRLVQHWLIKQISPIIERELIEDTFANRIGKGTLKTLDRTQQFMRQPNHPYYLQLDIQNFFNSIYRPKLLAIWQTTFNRAKNKYKQNTGVHSERLQLIEQLTEQLITQNVTENSAIISGHKTLLSKMPKHKRLNSSPINTGLPIGSIASQWFANLYLSPLDHFIKHKLKVKGYVRYMDDLFFLAKTPQTLNYWRQEISDFLEHKLKLQLHPKKQQLQLCERGADYLGYKIYPHYRHLRTRNIQKLKLWLRFFNQLITQQPITWQPNQQSWLDCIGQPFSYLMLQKMQATINSYYGLLVQANQYQLRKQLFHQQFGVLKHWLLIKNSDYGSVKIKNWVLPYWLNNHSMDE